MKTVMMRCVYSWHDCAFRRTWTVPNEKCDTFELLVVELHQVELLDESCYRVASRALF